MKLNKVVPYKLKRLIPMLGMAGATLFSGCSKEEIPRLPQRDVEVKIYSDDYSAIACYEGWYYGWRHIELPKAYADSHNIKNVYIVAEPVGWENHSAENVTELCQEVLKPTVDYSPKIKGKGDFNFKPGVASQVPADSLWLVQHGWTINKQKQY